LQPGAEALPRVVLELGEAPHQGEQDVLNQVRRVVVLQSGPRGPVIQEGTVEVYEAGPRLLVGDRAQTFQQTDGRRVHESEAQGRRCHRPRRPHATRAVWLWQWTALVRGEGFNACVRSEGRSA